MSLDIPSGIILLWPGSNGSIPSGFARNTDLDDKFTVGAANGANGGATGGSSTHTHGTTHAHGNTSHTHSFTTPPAIGSKLLDPYPGSGPTGNAATSDHTHAWTSPSQSLNWPTGPNFGSGSSEPSYYRMIFIESNGTAETYPTNCIVMRNDADGVSGWTQHAGSKSKYLRGASSGGNGGGTGGGSHTHSLASHTHGVGNHSHYALKLSGQASGEEGPVGVGSQPQGSGNIFAELLGHTHYFRATAGGGDSSGSAGAVNSSSHTQANSYFFLWGLEKTSSSADEDEGMIVLWDGTIGNIPEDWLLCDGSNSTPDLRDRFIKFANTSGEVGGTGGSNSHSHGGGSHSHSASSGHTHTVSGYPWPSIAEIPWPYQSAQGPWPPGTGLGSRWPYNYHNALGTWTTDSGTVSIPSTSASNNSVDATPPYRTVVYLFSPEGEKVGGNVGMFGSNF